MEKQVALRMLLTVTILCFFSFFYSGVHGTASLEIDMKLKALNKPALKTIKSEDGDIIDCVDIYKQPAFDHPALRNHKIQMKPSVELGSKETNIPSDSSPKPVTSKIWTKSGQCPVGKIPIRRANIVINLELPDMGLSSPIPVSLQYGGSLQKLDLSSNQLSGNIPPQLCTWLLFLVSLDMSNK
ncbi:uncharacterized protein LOC130495576 [Raphanus sativus]|uniref:Uncharacterized protein LOC130495576 n=1 Tax=Raphanus sativus TaxID=3726 RepID=A0A9W3BUD0_RAPSA|nr:uncharacterized protein LOC130495576 [Raphanus sativus]